MKKAQVEFIVVFALIVVGVVVALVAFQQGMLTPPPPSNIQEEMKTIKDSVVSMIRTGIREKLELVYNQGGYLNTDNVNGVEYTPYKVLYWQMCDKTNIPDVKNEIRKGLAGYIKDKLTNQTEFFGKNVSFDFSKLGTASGLKVDILKGKIKVQVNLPTTVSGYPIQQPYEAEVDTNIGEILEFSENFAKESSMTRAFELWTFSTINSFYDQYTLPRPAWYISDCSRPLFKTKSDVFPIVENQVVKYTVTHIVWNEKPINIGEPFYALNVINGKSYPNLNVYFIYPPNWDLEKHFSMKPNPLQVEPQPLSPFIPSICMTTYTTYYSVRYPVIVLVEDPSTKTFFNFAILVDMVDNHPGGCSGEFVTGFTEYEDLCINQAKYPVKISVTDTDENPIEGAEIVFDICDLGETSDKGVLEADVPYMLGVLKAYKPGYKTYEDILTTNELNNTIILQRMRDNVTVHFYSVPITISGGVYEAHQAIQTGSANPIQALITFGEVGTLKKFAIQNVDDNDERSDEIIQPGLYPGDFEVSGIIINNDTRLVVGHVNSSFTLNEDDSDLYVYLPAVEGLSEHVNVTETEALTNAVKDYCGGIVLKEEGC